MESRVATRTGGLFFPVLILLPLVCFSGPDVRLSIELDSVAAAARMHAARASHTSTLLPNGKVLIAGGFAGSGTENDPYPSTELYDPRTGSFQPAGNMTTG